MDLCKGVNGFDLQHYQTFYQKIDPITALKMNIFIDDRNSNFRLEPNSSNFKFILEAFTIGRFQQACPDLPMHLDSNTDDRFSDLVIPSRIDHPLFFSPSSAKNSVSSAWNPPFVRFHAENAEDLRRETQRFNSSNDSPQMRLTRGK